MTSVTGPYTPCFFLLLFMSMLCTGSVLHAQSVWWEAETRAVDNAEVVADGNSSGGSYLDVTVHREPLGLEYVVQVPEAGEYQLLVRQVWPRRDLRYRWNDAPWKVMKKPAWLDRQMHKGAVSWGWLTDGRFHDLPAGEHTIEISLEPGGKDPRGLWYPKTGFDCFCLTADSFAPVATVRPGRAVPEQHAKSRARSERVLAFWSTARRLEQVYEAGSIEHEGHALPYRLLTPEAPEEGRRYPLVVGLPSSGGRGTDNVSQLGACEPAEVLATEEFRKQYPCYVLVPQAPDWFADEARPKVTDTDLPMLTLLFKLIDEIEKQHPVDPDRIYLTGQSMGGFGVCNAMERNADRFAAAVMVAGSLPEKGKHFAGTPTWLFVGQYDARKAQAEATAAAIRSAGGEPKLTILPDTGHVAWPAAYAMDGVWEWLFSRQKAH